MIAASVFVFMTVLFLAYANGANDIYKGVATLYGGGAASYRVSLLWAIGATLAGSLLAAVLAEGLIGTFSGSGLVPEAVLADPSFVIAVSLGAAVTVFASALAGIPISTTHALTGALVGAALVAARSDLNFDLLGAKFLLPLAVSPLLSMTLVAALFPLLRGLTRRAGLTETSCICVSAVQSGVIASAGGAASILEAHRQIAVVGGDERSCAPARASDRIWKLEIAPLLRALHFLSAAAVSFARGANDTPKIVGIALLVGAFNQEANIFVIALAMSIGGLLHSRRIAETMATRILPYNEAEGTLANLVTSFLVVCASRFGLPVSTTHVSVSSLFGLGIAKRNAHWGAVGGIALSWLLTLPAAATIAALTALLLK